MSTPVANYAPEPVNLGRRGPEYSVDVPTAPVYVAQRAERGRGPRVSSSSSRQGRGRVENARLGRDNSHGPPKFIKLPVNLKRCRKFSVMTILLSFLALPIYLPQVLFITATFSYMDLILTVFAASFTIFNYWEDFVLKTHQLHHIFNLWVAALLFKSVAFVTTVCEMLFPLGFFGQTSTLIVGAVYLFFLVWSLTLNIMLVNSARIVVKACKPHAPLFCQCSV